MNTKCEFLHSLFIVVYGQTTLDLMGYATAHRKSDYVYVLFIFEGTRGQTCSVAWCILRDIGEISTCIDKISIVENK